MIKIKAVEKRDKEWGHRVFPKTGDYSRSFWVRSERDQLTRIYVHPEGEGFLENLAVGRLNRPWRLFRTEVVPQVLAQLGLSNIGYRWDQHAGCAMCPCSPGFVLDARLGYDIYVRAEYEKPTLSPRAARVVAARSANLGID